MLASSCLQNKHCKMPHPVLCCAVLCCAVLCCAVLWDSHHDPDLMTLSDLPKPASHVHHEACSS